MKKCSQCGNEFEGNFCTECGAPAPADEPVQTAADKSAAAPRRCRNCGKELSGNFCMFCGTPADQPQPAPVPPTPADPAVGAASDSQPAPVPPAAADPAAGAAGDSQPTPVPPAAADPAAGAASDSQPAPVPPAPGSISWGAPPSGQNPASVYTTGQLNPQPAAGGAKKQNKKKTFIIIGAVVGALLLLLVVAGVLLALGGSDDERPGSSSGAVQSDDVKIESALFKMDPDEFVERYNQYKKGGVADISKLTAGDGGAYYADMGSGSQMVIVADGSDVQYIGIRHAATGSTDRFEDSCESAVLAVNPSIREKDLDNVMDLLDEVIDGERDSGTQARNKVVYAISTDGDQVVFLIAPVGAPNSGVELPWDTAPAGGSSGSSSQSASSGTPSKTVNWHKEGMYKVGTDIPAGEYVVQNTSDLSCYIEVSSDSSGEFDSIITNDNLDTFGYITLQDGQYFTVNRGRFAAEAEVQITSKNGVYSEGMYKVGKDLPAGEYKVTCNSEYSCYIEVSSDSTGNFDSIITNDNFDGEKYVTVSEGQYLTVTRGTFTAA